MSGELEWVTSNHSGKAHISKLISKLNADQVTYSPTTFGKSTKLYGATPQKALKLRTKRELIIPMNLH
jgi:hypothetical protein